MPSRAGVSGGPTSLFDFADLGREGRRFVSQAYTADELEGVHSILATGTSARRQRHVLDTHGDLRDVVVALRAVSDRRLPCAWW